MDDSAASFLRMPFTPVLCVACSLLALLHASGTTPPKRECTNSIASASSATHPKSGVHDLHCQRQHTACPKGWIVQAVNGPESLLVLSQHA